MVATSNPPSARRMVVRAISPAVTLAVLMLVLVPVALFSAGETTQTPHPPISIVGDQAMDAFFEGSGRDGLTSGTAYVLEDLSIDSTGSGSAISIEDTGRHLVIRDCRLSTSSSEGNAGILLDGCSNVTIEGCVFPTSPTAVRLVGCRSVTVEANEIENQSAGGVSVDACVDVSVARNEVSGSSDAIVVRGSDDVHILDNRVWSSGTGIELLSSDGFTVSGNVVWWHQRNGVLLNNADGGRVEGNRIHDNGWTGLQLSDSRENLVVGNTIEDNGRGVWLTDSQGNSLLENNITSNDALGLRLTDSEGNTIGSNLIRANGALGIDLVGSSDNEFSDNTVMANIRGIAFSSSEGNRFSGNHLIANLWSAYRGDTSGNTFEGEKLRANSWLRGLVYLIVGLVVLGVATSVLLRVKRRHRVKDERGRVVVRRRFAAGRKGLWALSKVLMDEDFFRSQLESAGPQREQVLERYRHNIDSARQMQYMLVGIMAVMLAFMAAIPLAGLVNLMVLDVDDATVNDVLFATGTAIGIYQLMSMVVLLVFGLLFLAQLMKGDIFRLLATLPMDQRGNQRVVLYMLLRLYGAPIIVMLLAFPVGGFLLTWSVTFLVVSLLVNLLYVTLMAFVLVLIADGLSRRVFSANATRGATVLRVAVMGSYIVVMMTVFITLQYLVAYVAKLYVSERLAGGEGELVNSLVSLIPFPFSGGYLVAISVLPAGTVPAPVLVSTMVGMLLAIALTALVRSRAQRILERVARGQEIPGTGPGHVAVARDIRVVTRPPVRAFMGNAFLVTSRDMGSIIYLIMPIMFPFIIIMTMFSDPSIGTFAPVFPYAMYMGVTPFLVNMALSHADANIGGILSAIPFRTMDQYRAKWWSITSITLVPLVLIALLMFSLVPEPGRFLVLMASLVPLALVLAALFLVTFSLAFGTVNGRSTFFMARIEHKLLKYIGIIVLQYVLVVIELGAFLVLTGAGVLSFEAGIAGLWAVNVPLLAVLELSARRLFGPKALAAVMPQ